MERLECNIIGRVQGVFFRDFAAAWAKELGLVGTVENQSDGSVFVVAEGKKKPLEKFLEILKKGSPNSRVEKVEAKWLPTAGGFDGFSVL